MLKESEPAQKQTWIRKAQIRDVKQREAQANDNDVFMVILTNGLGIFINKETPYIRHLFLSHYTMDQNTPGTFISKVIIDHVEEDTIYIYRLVQDNGKPCESTPRPIAKTKFLEEYHLP